MKKKFQTLSSKLSTDIQVDWLKICLRPMDILLIQLLSMIDEIGFFQFFMSVCQDCHTFFLVLTISGSSRKIWIYVVTLFFCRFIKIAYLLFFES